MTSIYYSMTTMITVGYGDVHAYSYQEMLLASTVFGYTVNIVMELVCDQYDKFIVREQNIKVIQKEKNRYSNFIQSEHFDIDQVNQFEFYVRKGNVNEIILNINLNEDIKLKQIQQECKVQQKNVTIQSQKSYLRQSFIGVLKQKNDPSTILSLQVPKQQIQQLCSPSPLRQPSQPILIKALINKIINNNITKKANLYLYTTMMKLKLKLRKVSRNYDPSKLILPLKTANQTQKHFIIQKKEIRKEKTNLYHIG